MVLCLNGTYIASGGTMKMFINETVKVSCSICTVELYVHVHFTFAFFHKLLEGKYRYLAN